MATTKIIYTKAWANLSGDIKSNSILGKLCLGITEAQVIIAPQIKAGIKGFKLLSDYMMQGNFIWVGEGQFFFNFFALTH